MKHSTSRFATIAFAAAVAVSANAQTVFSGSGVAGTLNALNDFRTAIGGANNGGAAGSQPGGRREINWDAVKLDGTDANAATQVLIPGTLVNIPTNRFAARGLLTADPYSVSGDGFVTANGSLAGQINAFSPKNTFAMADDHVLEMSFSIPGSTTAAGTRGFGAIFNDVELEGMTTMEMFNGEVSLGSFNVTPCFSSGTSFLGVLFNDPQVTNVVLTLGTANIFNLTGNLPVSGPAEDIANGIDLVATDDFVFAEPTQAVPEPATMAVLGLGVLGVIRRRARK